MRGVCFFLLVLLPSALFAQVYKADSLKNEISKSLNERELVLLFLNIGDSYISELPDSSLSYAQKSLKLANQINYDKGKAQSFLLEGQALNALEKYDSALIALDKAEPIFKQNKDDYGLGKSYFEIGLSNYRKGLYDTTIYFLEKALVHFNEEKLLSEIAGAERIFGLCYWSLGKYADGLVHIEKAISLYKKLNDDINWATAQNTKGAILWGLANYEEALKCFFNALETQQRLGDNNERMIVYYNNIGLIYSDWGYRELALKYYQYAESLIPKSTNEIGIAYTYLNLGTHYLNVDEIERAIEFLEKSKNRYAEINDLNGVCLSKIRLGQCYYTKGNFERARKIFEDAIKDSKISGNTHREATAYFQLGRNDLALKNFIRAKKNTETSLQLAVKEQYKDLIYQLYQQLSQIYEQLGDIATSLDFLRKAIVLQDEIYKEKVAVQYDILDATNKMAQKDFENERLKTQNQIKGKTILYGSIAGSVIILLLIAITLYSYNLSKKRKELQRANEAKDKIFSIVAHDLRGPVGNLNNMIDILISEDGNVNYRKILNGFKPIITSTFNMLENLLVWAKSNLGNLDAVKQKTPLHQTIRETILIYKNIAKEKAITVEFRRRKEIYAFVDTVQLQTILRNLLNNAIKFTNNDGKIIIDTEIINQQVIVSVRDNGIGITQENQQRLFEGIVSSEGTNKERGSGIGILLCKELVENNGGKLWFTSIEGKGSTFNFSIPLFDSTISKTNKAKFLSI